MKLAALRKHAWWLVPVVLLAIGGGNWIINEIIVGVHLSRLDVSTTRQEVIDRLGEPDWETRWFGEPVDWATRSAGDAGDIFVYRYPYLWDFVLPLRETRTIDVYFRDGDDQLIRVQSHTAYSDSSHVVASRDPLQPPGQPGAPWSRP